MSGKASEREGGAGGTARAAGRDPTGAAVSAEPIERRVTVAGDEHRVWEKGSGPAVAFLAGLGGLPAWTPFLDELAAQRRVIAPSLPGFPGGGAGHRRLDDLLDWIAATLDLLEAAGVEPGTDLVGASVGGLLAAEVAALCRPLVRRLVLVAPFGIFDPAEPSADPFSYPATDLPALLAARPEALGERMAAPPGTDEVEWFIVLNRAAEAAARLLWPLGDRGLARRLHRIAAPTLVVWGEGDRILPPSYARRFAEAISGPVETDLLAGAGHLVDVDAPSDLAARIERFLAA